MARYLHGRFPVAQIDGAVAITIARLNNVRDFPTFMAFSNGQAIDVYPSDAPRKLWHLKGWVDKVLASEAYPGRPVRELATELDFAAFLASVEEGGSASSERKLVAALNMGSDEVGALLQVAKDKRLNRAVSFALTYDETIVGAEETLSVPWVRLYDPGVIERVAADGREVLAFSDYRGELSVEPLTQWLLAEVSPAIVDMSDAIAMRSLRTKVPLCILFYDDAPDAALAALRRVAANFKAHFAFVSANMKNFPTLMKTFPDAPHRPALVINDRKGKRLSMQEPFTEESASAFVSSYLAGRAKQEL